MTNHAPAIAVREVTFGGTSRALWDEFALRCGVSARGTYEHLWAWGLKNTGRFKVRLFELLAADGSGEKIAQCAVGVNRHGRCLFLPRLQFTFENDSPLWLACMTGLLTTIGATSYEYGWELSLEPAREHDLAEIPGVEITSVRPLVVHAVDFSRWDSWEAYYRAMSENSRRNAKAAERSIPDLALKIRTRRSALAALPALVRLRNAQAKRKQLDLVATRLALNLMGAILTSPRYVLTAIATGGGKTLSACYAWELGDNFYYLDAGSRTENQGAAWRLLIALLQRTYERAPRGKFIMGYIDYALHDEAHSGGLLRSRNACRVSDYPTSILNFRFNSASALQSPAA